MRAAENFQVGLGAVRQMEFALIDMLLHTAFEPAGASNETVQQLVRAVRDEVAVLPVPAYQRMTHAFSHIFAGGYAAGYYSYKWAHVMSADAFGLFEEQGVLDRDVGARFLREILEVGGSRPAKESFRAFRGRDPQVDALLRHQGMLQTA
jgi:oligopeptidase A